MYLQSSVGRKYDDNSPPLIPLTHPYDDTYTRAVCSSSYPLPNSYTSDTSLPSRQSRRNFDGSFRNDGYRYQIREVSSFRYCNRDSDGYVLARRTICLETGVTGAVISMFCLTVWWAVSSLRGLAANLFTCPEGNYVG